MKKKIATLLALLAIAGFAAASALTVKQRQDTASLHAERYTVGDLFVIDTTPGLAPVAAQATASGPQEMTAGLTPVRTALTQDHWMYTVIVREKTPGGVASGEYVIELQLDGATIGSLRMTQATADAAAVEGVRASFGLGATVSKTGLYYVVVRPYVPTGPTVDLTVRSAAASGTLPVRWVGVGGSIDSKDNPPLPLALGSTLRLTARNDDGAYHNVGFVPSAASTTPFDPPGWSGNIDASGEETQIEWKPTTAGTYYYRCQFHDTMAGQVVVS